MNDEACMTDVCCGMNVVGQRCEPVVKSVVGLECENECS
jgi:hypothetical protein